MRQLASRFHEHPHRAARAIGPAVLLGMEFGAAVRVDFDCCLHVPVSAERTNDVPRLPVQVLEPALLADPVNEDDADGLRRRLTGGLRRGRWLR